MLNQNQAKLDQNQPNPNNHHQVNNFFFGFALGVGAAGAAAFFLGTKKGRKMLKSALELSENLEENLLLLGEELGQTLAEKGIDLREELKNLPKQVTTTVSHFKKEHHGLDGLLHKIKALSPSPVKKFFAKEGKIINP